MYDVTKIKALSGIVGINQPANPDYSVLDSTNTASASGIFVDDISKFYKIEYLKDTQDYFGISDENFNALLVRDQQNALMRVINDVYSQPDVIESLPMFTDNPDEWNILVDKQGFVGYEIELGEKANLGIKINKVWSYFSESGTIKLLLLNQFKNAVIGGKEIAVTANDITETTLDFDLTFSGSIMAGRYYIGYLINGTTPKPLNGSRCINGYDNICIRDVYVKDWDSETIFPYKEADGAGFDFGLNFDISVHNDWTASVQKNKLMFARATALRMVIDALKSYKSSLRVNANKRFTDAFLQSVTFEIEGNPELKIYGLKQEYFNEIKRIRKGFTPSGNKINIAVVT